MSRNSPKITFVIHAMVIGGAETHLLRLLPHLQKAGWDVCLFCMKKDGAYIPIIESLGIPVVGLARPQILKRFLLAKIIHNIAAMFYFWFFLYRHKPDVVHFFLPPSYMMMASVSLLKKNLVRVMSRRSMNNYQKKYPKFFREIELMLHRRMDGISGNSRAVIDQLADDEGVSRRSLRLIYNGIEMADKGKNIREKLCRQLRIEKDAMLMVIVANLFAYKGHRDLLEACGRLKAKGWHLLIVGRDVNGNRAALESLATKHRIDTRVHFLGERQDVSDILASSDMALLASHEEGFSNAILEAMRAGLPLVVTDVGGNSEAVLHDKTGLIVPEKDSQKFARAMDRLLGDRALRQKMGKAGKARVKREFSMQKCVSDYQDFYRDVLKKHKRRL